MDTPNNAGESASRIICICDIDLQRRVLALDVYRTSDSESETDAGLAKAIETALGAVLSEIFPLR